jgi:hypothetical protein
MKRFLARVLIFVLLQGIGLFFFRGSNLPEENNYLARTIGKHERLRTTKSPRLILIGGSNVAFGFISEELNNGLKMPVVNMGLVAGLGLEFMLHEVWDEIRAGDVVVLSPEYDFGGGGRDLQVIRQLLELRPESAAFVTLKDWRDGLADSGLNWMGGYLRRAVLKAGRKRTVEEGVYRRDGFDEANCYVAHHGLPSLMVEKAGPGKGRVRTVVHPIESRVLELLRNFSGHCAKAGAKCVFTCPPQPPDLLETNLADVQRIIRKVKTLQDLIVVDSPEEQIYPLEQFYDTQYHLTREGAVRRSRLLVERVKALM